MLPILLPLLEGLVAGLVVASLAFVVHRRTQRTGATRILAAARDEATALVAQATAKAAEAKNQLLVEGRLETLRLREDLDREGQRRREEWDRLERRAEERDKALENP